MTKEEFVKYLYDKNNGFDDEIFPPPTNAQEGLNILINHFLGDDWYCFSTNNEQGNTEAICEILSKYPRRKRLFGFKIKKPK